MSNRTSNPFPATVQDIARLKQTAIDAVSDLGSTAVVHASKAKEHFHDLRAHAQEEGAEQFQQAKGKLHALVGLSRDYVAENPLLCLGAALTFGFLIGLTRRRRSTH